MNDIYIYELLFFILIIVLAIIKLILKPKYPYYKNPYFISFAERSFFNILKTIVEDKYYIFPQVSLNSLLKINLHGKEYWKYINKINQKSVDFVLVDKTNFNPVLIIELDDMSHILEYRKQRDEFLEKSLTNAGIKYLRIKNQPSYNIAELKEAIFNLIS